MADLKGSSKLHINFLSDVSFLQESPATVQNCIVCFCDDSKNTSEKLFLSKEENSTAAKFHFEKDKILYESTHHTLRKVLAKYLHVPPLEIIFKTIPSGKPYIDTPDSEIQFNISHSREKFFIALSETSVGADLEYINPSFDFESIIDNYFLAAEKKQIIQSKNPTEEFFKLWAIKESVLKFFGRGIGEMIKKINVAEKKLDINHPHELFISAFAKDGYAFSVCAGLPFEVCMVRS